MVTKQRERVGRGRVPGGVLRMSESFDVRLVVRGVVAFHVGEQIPTT